MKIFKYGFFFSVIILILFTNSLLFAGDDIKGIMLKDGTKIYGTITELSPEKVVVTTNNVGKITKKFNDIEEFITVEKEEKYNPPVGLKIVDALFVRPACVAGATISTISFIIIAIPVHVAGFSEFLGQAMVYAPWRFASQRHLGEFGAYKDDGNMIGGSWEY